MKLEIEVLPDGRACLWDRETLLHTYPNEAEANAAKDLLAGDMFLPDGAVSQELGASRPFDSWQANKAPTAPTLSIPLYPQYGGPPLAFACGQCGDVTKTKIGIWRHLWRKHKIKLQRELFDETAK